MKEIYQIIILGNPTDEQVSELKKEIATTLSLFNLKFGDEVALYVRDPTFVPQKSIPSVAVFFGHESASTESLQNLLDLGVPVLPIVSELPKVATEIPSILRSLNCLPYAQNGAQRIATALLECIGLLPKQRRVFVSYRRDEAREAALQLFDILSARMFDVFLDTHGIPYAEDFQTMLWHRLCDSDVLIMLDTQGYFESRWTSAEFGRALAKGISVLRIGWPDTTPSARTATASRVELLENEVSVVTGRLSHDALNRICLQLERVRSQSQAVRTVNLISHVRTGLETIGGELIGIGLHKSMLIRLADNREIVVYPTVGVPTSTTLHDAAANFPHQSVAVLYDHIGLHPKWLNHLDWLGNHVKAVRWVKASEASWQFADWEN